MRRANSRYTLTVWILGLIVILAGAVGAFLISGSVILIYIYAAILILFNASILLDHNTAGRKVSYVLLWILSAAAAVLSGHVFGGLIALAPLAIAPSSGRKIFTAPAFVITLAGIISGLYMSSLPRNVNVILPFIVTAVFAGGCLLLYFINKTEKSSEDLQDALRISALDSLSERKLREELARQTELSKMNAKLEERERISRDIHNSVGHTLAAASVTLDAAQLLIDEDKDMAASKMAQANVRVREAMDSIRSAVRTLDSEDDTVLLPDYAASLKETVKGFAMDTQVTIHDNFDMIKDEIKIPIDIAAFLSGALTEFLTNGVKHGGATVFVTVLSASSENISLKVQDNGSGWKAEGASEREALLKSGFGIRKTRDHAKALGGNMTFDGDDGFEVRIDLPLINGKE